METITLNEDIKVLYVNADSFPAGVMKAHEQLHALIPFSAERKYYGLSRPENGGGIAYKAAAEEINDGEDQKYGLDSIVIKKGNYISITVENYMTNTESIGNAFQELLKHPGLDPQGYCVELYLTDTEVQCMIRLEE